MSKIPVLSSRKKSLHVPSSAFWTELVSMVFHTGSETVKTLVFLRLGLSVNRDKSGLISYQNIVFLGERLDFCLSIAFPSETRKTHIVSAAQDVLYDGGLLAKRAESRLGLLSASFLAVPIGSLYLRLFQWAVIKEIRRGRTVSNWIPVTDLASKSSQIVVSGWALSPQAFHWTVEQSSCGPPQIDLFAYARNHRLHRYFSPYPDRKAMAIDTLKDGGPVRFFTPFPQLASYFI